MSQDRKFDTGARRSRDADSARYDLISPIGLQAVAEACAEGAVKYSDFNWERGMPVHDLLNHVVTHIYKYLSGDRSEPHLGHAGWGVLAAIHSAEMWPHLNKGHLRGPGCTLGDDIIAAIEKANAERDKSQSFPEIEEATKLSPQLPAEPDPRLASGGNSRRVAEFYH